MHIEDTVKIVGTVDIGSDFRVGFVDLAMPMNSDAALLMNPILPEGHKGGTFVRVAHRMGFIKSATLVLVGTFGSGVVVAVVFLSTLFIVPRGSMVGRGSTRTHLIVRALWSLADAQRMLAALGAENGAIVGLLRMHPQANTSSRGGARLSGFTSPVRACSATVSMMPPTKRATARGTSVGLLLLTTTMQRTLPFRRGVQKAATRRSTGRRTWARARRMAPWAQGAKFGGTVTCLGAWALG